VSLSEARAGSAKALEPLGPPARAHRLRLHALAILAGALLSIPFLPGLPGLSYFFPLFLVPLVRLAEAETRCRSRARDVWLLGFSYGGAFALVLMAWIPELAPDYLVYRWIMWPALLALAVYLALFPSLAFTAAVLLARRSRLPVFLLLAASWTVAEWIGSRGALGFTWLAVGYGWWSAPVFLQTLDLYGLFGLSFLTIVLAGLLARRSARRLLGAGALIAAMLGYGAFRLRERPPGGPSLTVALIQPNLGVSEKWAPENREALFQRYLHQSRRATQGEADVIVWPETATPFLLLYAPQFVDRIRSFVEAEHVPILTGTPHAILEGEEEIHYNAAALFEPGGGDPLLYYKRQLVPFSEWLPWGFLRVMEVDFGQASFTPGTSADPIPIAGREAGILICIEAIFPHLARAAVDRGAEFLVNITNDVWFGRSPAIGEHANMARYRAVELRRPMVRCANTGVSMLVDRTGRDTKRLDAFVMGEIRGTIQPETTRTVYARFGEWILGVAGGVVLLGILARRPPTPPESPHVAT